MEEAEEDNFQKQLFLPVKPFYLSGLILNVYCRNFENCQGTTKVRALEKYSGEVLWVRLDDSCRTHHWHPACGV